MKSLMTRLALAACATLLVFATSPPAYAQSDIENSTFMITDRLEVGSFTLEPGTYLIRVVMLSSDRETIQVTNVEQSKVFATVLATPHPIRAGESIPQSRYVYYAAAPGQNRALRTWFGRDTTKGHDIVYPKRRAMELAVAAKEPVIAAPDEVQEAEYKVAPLEVVTPDQKVLPFGTQYEVPPPVVVAEARPAELPKTASRVPLFALLGLLSLGGAFGLRALANRMA